jgi:hypothetical protein
VFENLIQANCGTKNLRSGHDEVSPSWKVHVVAGVEMDLDASSITEADFSFPISDPFFHQALLS